MFSDVKHKIVFDFFTEISQIPRGSGNEKAIADHLENFAKDRGLYFVHDEANNILIRKPSFGDCMEDSSPIVLQGHTDMVCEADPGITHDFLKDPIEFIREGDKLKANGTTLGADNGVAVAIMMALLDSKDVCHPELECLFTVGEEVGMDGMTAFDTSLLRSRRMINLDSAGEGVATVSCAGGVRSDFRLTPETITSPAGVDFYEIKISGFYGGHSGEDINLGRSNAIETLARVLRAIAHDNDVYIVNMRGGEKDNAIPRDCKANIGIKKGTDIKTILNVAETSIRRELSDDDSGFTLECVPSDKAVRCFSAESSAKLIDFLGVFRSGPVMMSKGISGLVETSYNLSIIRADADGIRATVTSRSSVEESLDEMEYKMKSIGRLSGAEVTNHSRYPGWKYADVSPMRDTYLSVYKELYGENGIAIGIHAGLECGLLMERVPDMDIISIGPDIKDLHSPSETLGISSLDRLYDIVLAILARG